MFFSGLIVSVLAVAAAAAQKPGPKNEVDGFLARVHQHGRETMPYRLFVPPAYDVTRTYPLIIWLHGGGGAGQDNLRQISEDQIPGTRTWTRADRQAKYPAFVFVPQSPGTWGAQPGDSSHDALSAPLRLVLEILESLKTEFRIDSQRIYVAGQSDGGYGTWTLIIQRPDLFAAAIVLCGGGVPARAAPAARVAIWAFHGAADKVVPVAAGRRMVAAVQKAGGTPRYTEYKGVGHEIWMRAFAEPGLVEWLFAQHK